MQQNVKDWEVNLYLNLYKLITNNFWMADDLSK